ncbi:MAG: Cof-type HAD-IIB family hydrolase [Treponema sp.]|jgi:Cof subfamily protein (haloacid dehalogenase superfamily)|nr:Cof-type HAD-IIB family hydrolase [Treponema sp.]
MIAKTGPDPRTVKALALDLDGTVLRPDNTLSGRTISVLKSCMDRGIQVIFCTGRAIAAAEPYRTAIGAEGPMVYYNGAEVVDMPAGIVLGSTLLDLDVADFCVDLARNRGIHFQVFFPAVPGETGEILMIEKDSPEAEIYRRHTGLQPVLGDLKKIIARGKLPGCLKGMFIAEPEVQDAIRPLLIERFGGRIYAARTYPLFLELMAAGVSKGTGLRAAMKNRGLDAAGVIALGDEENDLPLFEAAGFSAAPANAKETVRAAAGTIIGSNAEDGVAAYLEGLFLGQR